MVLANDDFGVDAEVARAAKNFHDAAGGSSAATTVMQQFGVDDSAIEFGNVRQTLAATRLVFLAGKKLLAKRRGEFFAGGQLNVVLDARVVGNHNATLRGVTKQSDDRRMRATDDANDAAFGATRSGKTAEARESGNDRVAVHGIFDVIARNENIAVDVGKRHIRNHEAVAILVQDEAALDFIAGSGLVLREFICGFQRATVCGYSEEAGGFGDWRKRKRSWVSSSTRPRFFSFSSIWSSGPTVIFLQAQGAREILSERRDRS